MRQCINSILRPAMAEALTRATIPIEMVANLMLDFPNSSQAHISTVCKGSTGMDLNSIRYEFYVCDISSFS